MTNSAHEPLHSHVFDRHDPLAERRTRQVMWLTAAMMIVEIVAGTLYGSMALLADGWHMSSHALALGVSAGAYALARRHAADPRFAFGTWKIEVLGGYTSAVVLLGVAAYMGVESLRRLVTPAPIAFEQAIPVAVIGLVVNLVSAWLLASAGHGHGHPHGHGHDDARHDHDHDHDHDDHERPPLGADAAQGLLAPAAATSHGNVLAPAAQVDAAHGSHAAHGAHTARGAHAPHGDLNLRSAYLHVVADAATSVLAIVALLGGRWYGANWLDPVMGLVGTVLVARWALGLLRETGRVLLDAEMDAPVVDRIRSAVAALPERTRLRDLHVWRVGKGKYATIVSIETSASIDPDAVRRRLAAHDELVHVTVEISAPRAA